MSSAAESNGRARSGAYSREKRFIADLTDEELSNAHTWPRFAENWKQALLEQEQKRRGNSEEEVRQSIPLTRAQWKALEMVAAETGSLAERGENAGKPSWRTLLRRIADGELMIKLAETTDD